MFRFEKDEQRNERALPLAVRVSRYGACEDAGGRPECGILKNWTYSPKEAARIWNTRTVLTADLYDKEEVFPDCTVQLLINSQTGETSVGWWPNKKGETE